MQQKSPLKNIGQAAAVIASKAFTVIVGVIVAALIAYSAYAVYDSLYIEGQAYGNNWDILRYRPEVLDDPDAGLSAETVAAINSDYRAWLFVPDTNIDYPVLQGKDDLYYASHDVFKKSSLTGALYLAAANTPDFSDNFNIIYGHYMDNNAFFGGLKLYREQKYFDKHKTGVLVTPDKVYDVTFFAMTENDAHDSIYSVGGNKDLSAVLDFIAAHKIIYNRTDLPAGAKLLALSTCEAAATNGRLLLFGVMTERTRPDVTPGGDGTDQRQPGQPGDSGNGGPGDGQPGTPGDNGNGQPGTPGQNDTNGGNHGNSGNNGGDSGRPDDGGPFDPRGNVNENNCWAIINLICLIFLIVLCIPFMYLRARFGKDKILGAEGADGADAGGAAAGAGSAGGTDDAAGGMDEDTRKGFRRRTLIALLINIVLAVGALILFILTQNMKYPMVLIDGWTPIFLVLLVVGVLVVVLIAMPRGKKKDEDADPGA